MFFVAPPAAAVFEKPRAYSLLLRTHENTYPHNHTHAHTHHTHARTHPKLFSQDTRAKVVADNPDMSFGDIGRELVRVCVPSRACVYVCVCVCC